MTSHRGHHCERYHNRCIVIHSIGPEVVRRCVVAGLFLGTGGGHVGLVLQSMWEKKGSTFMVHLALARRIGRLEVVRQCGTADIVASRVPEDDEEHGAWGVLTSSGHRISCRLASIAGTWGQQ